MPIGVDVSLVSICFPLRHLLLVVFSFRFSTLSPRLSRAQMYRTAKSEWEDLDSEASKLRVQVAMLKAQIAQLKQERPS